MDGWSSDEDLFGGGMSLEELSAQNADKLVNMFETTDAKLYGEIVIEKEEENNINDNNNEKEYIMDRYGYCPPPPPEPCHLEWNVFTNLRIRGKQIVIPTQTSSSTHSQEDEVEEIISIHPNIENQMDESMNDNENEKNTEIVKEIWNHFILECVEKVQKKKMKNKQFHDKSHMKK